MYICAKIISRNELGIDMSRIIVDVSGEQHQVIKALAATEGKSIKEYVLERILPTSGDGDQEAAWAELKALLDKRIKNASSYGVSSKSIRDITESTLRDLGKL